MGKILEIKNKALENNIPIMQDEGINFICDYIKNNNIHNILEIGSAVGYSAINFASVREDVEVTTIERDINRYNEAIKNINDVNLNDRITIINGDALETKIDGTFDLIFIDAAKSQYIKFFNRYKDNLSFHGIVDDISLTHNRNTRQLVGKIKKYIDFLKNNEEFDTTFYKLGDGVSVSKIKK